jgi:hypothetical protein
MAFVIVLWKNRKRRRVGKENSSSVFQGSKPLKIGSRSLLRRGGSDQASRSIDTCPPIADDLISLLSLYSRYGGKYEDLRKLEASTIVWHEEAVKAEFTGSRQPGERSSNVPR